jgi:CheY-like chemotaxis protein
VEAMTIKQVAGRRSSLPDEVERLLQQVEGSTTHYEALGIAHSAIKAQIEIAHQKLLALLRSSKQALNFISSDSLAHDADQASTDEMRKRIDRALNRVSQAFSVLSNGKKRFAYDRFAIISTTPPQSTYTLALNEKAAELDAYPALAQPSDGANSSSKDNTDCAVKSDLDAGDNRRRSHRYGLSISAQVVGYDRKAGKWEEAAETIDVSRTGLNMLMRRRVRHGVILRLTLPLPAKLRNHSLLDATYSVYAFVRRVEPSQKGFRVVGVEFVGQRPPVGYLDKPWATFQSKQWGGTDRRRKPRQERTGVVWIEYFTESRQCITQEAGRIENVSQGGLRACVKAAPADFELARISYPDKGIETYADIRNRYFCKDGFERLCLKFIDNDDLAGRATAGLKSRAESNHNDLPRAVESMKAEPQSKAASKNYKILVADDDPPLRKVLGKILTSAGYEVILVEDGKAAVEMAKSEKPDLVITDGLMPKMHGFLVCKAIKELQSPPKVILLTAVYTKMHYKWEAKRKYGADELMTKPFEVAELLSCIKRHLAVSPGSESPIM